MSYIPFNRLSETARLWVFAADRDILTAEGQLLLAEMQAFVNSWTAHNAALTASCDLKFGRFLFIAVHEESASASGCSIDEMMRRVRLISETHGIEFFGLPRVQYRDGSGSIHSILRSEFADQASKGDFTLNTIIFDNTISTLGELSSGKWELPARESWHGRTFW